MLDSGGGGGGGGGYAGSTNWYGYDVPTMWTMLERQKTNEHWTHVSGWRKTFELTSMHLSRLKEYRDRLAEAWPPTSGSASEAYVDRLNGLIDHVRKTYDIAVANYDVAAGAIGAISTARYELKQVNDEYVVKAQQKKDYDDVVASQTASQLPGTTLPSPPVTDAELERLNAKARSIMYGLSGELVDAQVRLQQPPPKPVARNESDPDVYGGSTVPVIPPVVPMSPPASAGPAVSVAGSAGAGTTAIAPAPLPTLPGTGPVLGGVGNLPSPASPAAPGVIATATPPVVPGGGLVPTVPFVPGVPANSRPSPRPGGIGARLPGAALPPGAGSTSRPGTGGLSGPRPMPPGGLIGAAPGAGLTQPGAAPAARRINPVGGVIGGAAPANGSASRPAGSAGARPLGGVVSPLGGGSQRPVGGATGGASRTISGGAAARPLPGGPVGGLGSRAGQPGGAAGAATAGGVSGTARIVLGSAGARGAVTGAAGIAPQPNGHAPTHRHHERRDEEKARRWDPDRPWETDPGVAPVVVPPPLAQRIDPGPAIGLDR